MLKRENISIMEIKGAKWKDFKLNGKKTERLHLAVSRSPRLRLARHLGSKILGAWLAERGSAGVENGFGGFG